MPDKQMAHQRPILGRNELLQINFNFFRRAVAAQFQPCHQARHMRIHHNSLGHAEGIAQDDIGRFASHPGQLHQFRHVARNFASVFFHQGTARSLNVFGFVPVEPGAFNVFLQRRRRRFGIIPCRPIFLEERLRHQIHPLVRALGGKDGGDEQFERIGVIEFAVGIGIGFLESAKDV